MYLYKETTCKILGNHKITESLFRGSQKAYTWTFLILGSSLPLKVAHFIIVRKIFLLQNSVAAPIGLYLPGTACTWCDSRSHVPCQALSSEWMQHCQHLKISRHFLGSECAQIHSCPFHSVSFKTKFNIPSAAWRCQPPDQPSPLWLLQAFVTLLSHTVETKSHQLSSTLILNHHQDLKTFSDTWWNNLNRLFYHSKARFCQASVSLTLKMEIKSACLGVYPWGLKCGNFTEPGTYQVLHRF